MYVCIVDHETHSFFDVSLSLCGCGKTNFIDWFFLYKIFLNNIVSKYWIRHHCLNFLNERKERYRYCFVWRKNIDKRLWRCNIQVPVWILIIFLWLNLWCIWILSQFDVWFTTILIDPRKPRSHLVSLYQYRHFYL